MMDLCPDAADQQNSKLDEFILVSRRIKKAGCNAHASSPTDRKNSSIANGSFAQASPEHRKAPSKLISRSSGDTIGKEQSRAQIRRFRSSPRISRGSRRKARRRKLPRPGAMATANHEELILNGRLRHSRLWKSRRKSEGAHPKARASRAPIRYLQSESLPFPASQILLLLLQVSEEAQRARRPPLPGKRRGSTFSPPGQKLRKQETRNKGIRATQ
ncbi:unnamed protein product [Sphagnum balticum]